MSVLTWDERVSLRDRELLPREAGGRLEAPRPGVDTVDRYRGALIGLAIGDAMGRPVAGAEPSEINRRFGTVKGYITKPIPRWGLPAGQIGDETQLALVTAAAVAATGRLDPAELSHRLMAWLPVARSPEADTRQAVRHLRNGQPWLHSGIDSPGSTPAVRSVVVGLLHPADLDALRQAAALATVPTHADPTAVAGAVAMAAAVAHLVRLDVGGFGPGDMVKTITQALDAVNDPAVRADSARVIDRVHLGLERAGLDAAPRPELGGSILDTLPAALWSFAVHAEDPIQAIQAAVNRGGPSDTVAALTGALVGAYHGAEALPPAWVDHLEYLDGLAGHADAVHAVAQGTHPDRPFRMGDPLRPSTYAPFRLGGSTLPTVEHAIRASSAADPGAAVKARLTPTPADARRYAAGITLRLGWAESAAGIVLSVLRRRFEEDTPEAARLIGAGDDELEELGGSFADDPFDYPLLLAMRRQELTNPA